MIPNFVDLEAERAGTLIVLPFPPASLSGHAKGQWWDKSGPTAKHRQWACLATIAASPPAPCDGDVRLHVHFVPPDRRGDRVNFWNRMKPAIDGIAAAMKINDARFLPSMSFGAPEKPGRVEVTVG
jgi:hypothetical protein